jgi:mRNA interferase RelE/StbE
LRKKKTTPESPAYRLFLRPSVHQARKRLPGKIRRRIARSLDDLGRDPRPPGSTQLRLPKDLAGTGAMAWEVRRLRLEDYRVVYAVSEAGKEVAVLAVEKRPPYNYQDIERLLADLPD